MENPSPPEHMVEEAVKRNLDCAPESAKKKAQEDTGLQIMIYDADFSDSDLDELSQNDLNKTDFDFSEFKIVKNHKNGNSKILFTRQKIREKIFIEIVF